MKIFLISVGALAILSVSIGSLLVYQAYDRANANWQLFSDKQVEITVLMNELLQSMGYGGFIHHFKNAVLRHDLVHLEIASQRIKEAQDTIVKLKALNAFESPNDHWDILKTINAYQQKLDTAKLHITKGSEIDYIDFLVKVDDTEAFAALGRFENRITSQLKEQLAANLSDMETAKSLQSKVTVFVVILILIVFFLLYRYIRTNKTLLLRATESEKAKDRFLSNMSHEI
ncbi:MAG: hypothetical protein HWE10_00705, partial [Gammaproteobacteria bacterium]|nr:hypothetical protein [Gammaproteobacteria bacterium]